MTWIGSGMGEHKWDRYSNGWPKSEPQREPAEDLVLTCWSWSKLGAEWDGWLEGRWRGGWTVD